jgi:branched-chain amino acid transport system substrate-binding protein
MARYAFGELCLTKIAILYINNGYGLGLREPFRRAFEMLGGKIVAEDSFLQGTNDFGVQFKAISRSEPQAVYLVGDPAEMARCVQQARDAGKTWKFLSVGSFDDPKMRAIAEREKIIITNANVDLSSPISTTSAFVAAFRKRYGRYPEPLAATGYDALTALVKALDNSRGDRNRVPDELKALHAYDGVAGVIRFDERGDVTRSVRVGGFEKAVFVPLKPRVPDLLSLPPSHPCRAMLTKGTPKSETQP